MNPSKRATSRVIVILLLLIGSAFLASPRQTRASSPSQTRVIKVTARRFQFDPKVITVNQGDRVELIVTSLDVDHGIEIKGYGINQRLKKGVPTRIDFVADKPGTFPFRCSVYCGVGHRGMKGQLVVEPKS